MLNITKISSKYWYALISLFIIPISGVSTDVYVPSLPAVSDYFHVDKSLSQLTITSYMLGFAIMQLFAGAISDSFGRKKPFMMAMFFFIITTLCIPLSNDIYQLLFLRLVQGVLIAVIMVSMRSIIPDLFEKRELNVMMTYMVMAWSIGPIVAPAIGGYLQHYLGWKANFYFLASYSLLGFLMVIFFLPETSHHRYPFHPATIVKRYRQILSHKNFFTGFIVDGLLYSIPLLFAVIGPFLVQTVLHYSAVQFGHMALLIGLAWFMGAMTSRVLVNIDLAIKTKIGLSVMSLIVFSMLFFAIYLPLNLYSIILPVLMLSWISGILFPRYAARSISLFPESTGSANALFGGFVFIITGVNSALASLLESTTQLPLVVAYIAIISLCWIVTCRGHRARQVDQPASVV